MIKVITGALVFIPAMALKLGNYLHDRWMAMFGGDTLPASVKNQNEAAANIKDASKDLKDAAYATKQGVVGGGERARGAIPTAWTWNQSMLINNSRNLGAFEY